MTNETRDDYTPSHIEETKRGETPAKLAELKVNTGLKGTRLVDSLDYSFRDGGGMFSSDAATDTKRNDSTVS